MENRLGNITDCFLQIAKQAVEGLSSPSDLGEWVPNIAVFNECLTSGRWEPENQATVMASPRWDLSSPISMRHLWVWIIHSTMQGRTNHSSLNSTGINHRKEWDRKRKTGTSSGASATAFPLQWALISIGDIRLSMNEMLCGSHSAVLVHLLSMVNRGPAGPCKLVKRKKRSREGKVQEVVRSFQFPWGHFWQETGAQDKHTLKDKWRSSCLGSVAVVISYLLAKGWATVTAHIPSHPPVLKSNSIFSIHHLPLCRQTHSCWVPHGCAEMGLGDFWWMLPIFNHRMTCGCGGSL